MQAISEVTCAPGYTHGPLKRIFNNESRMNEPRVRHRFSRSRIDFQRAERGGYYFQFFVRRAHKVVHVAVVAS